MSAARRPPSVRRLLLSRARPGIGTLCVVADDPTRALALREPLEADGHRVVEAASLPDARWLDGRVDAVVVDLDGAGAWARHVGASLVRAPRRWAALAVLPTSASEARIAQALEAGFDDVVPVDRTTELRARLQRLVAALHRGPVGSAGSERDPVTGLLTRGALASVLGGLAGGGDDYAVLLVDVSAGGGAPTPTALATTAEVVALTVGSTGLVARFGPQTLCAVLTGADLARAGEIAARCRMAAQHGRSRPDDARVTLSVGVAATAHPAEPWEAVVARADRALFEADLNGGDVVELRAPSQRLADSGVHRLADVTVSSPEPRIRFGRG